MFFSVGGKNNLPEILLTLLSSGFFLHNSITVDEIQAKVALVHDEERVLSEDEAVVSRLLFIQKN